MSNFPPPPVSPPAAPQSAPPAGFGGHAMVGLLIGIIFLYLGWPAVSGLLQPSANPYGYKWVGDHPQAGQLVPFFQVELGPGWRDLGALATGIVLLAEAAIYGLITARPARQRTLAGVVIVLGIAGCAANGLSAVMQYQAGYRDLPLFAIVGLILCVLSVMQAKPLRA